MPACDAFVVLLCPIRACSSCAARAPARSVDTSKDDSCGATMLSGPTGPAKTRGLRLAVDPRHFEVRAAVKRDGALIRRSNSDSRHCRRLPYHDRGRKRRGRRFTGLDASRVTIERSAARGRPRPAGLQLTAAEPSAVRREARVVGEGGAGDNEESVHD